MWAVGNKWHSWRGFTLLELLVVIAIIAIASAGVSLALRDNDATALEREAQRVAAVIEAARAQSRNLGVALAWVASAEGFAIVLGSTLTQGQTDAVRLNAASIQPWLSAQTTAQARAGERDVGSLQLGPEPMLPVQSVELRLGGQSLRIASDGLRPFAVQTAP